MAVTPVFESEKIKLRPFTPEDAPALHAYLSHPELAGRRCLPWGFEGILPFPPQVAEEIIKNWNELKGGFAYAIILKEGDALIGHVSTNWEWDAHMTDLAVVVSPPHQRKGYGTQAAKMVLDYLFGFTMAHNVSTGITEWNQPAQDFVRYLGYTQVGVRRDSVYLGGRFYNVNVFDILKSEWKGGKHAS